MSRTEVSHPFRYRAGRCVAFAAVGLLGTLTSAGAPSHALARPLTSAKLRAVEGYGERPLHFEVNQGQAAAPVKFLTRGSGYGLFLTPTESVLVLQKTATEGSTKPPAVVRMKMRGANPRPAVTGHQKLPGKSNYFIGNDPTSGGPTSLSTRASNTRTCTPERAWPTTAMKGSSSTTSSSVWALGIMAAVRSVAFTQGTNRTSAHHGTNQLQGASACSTA